MIMDRKVEARLLSEKIRIFLENFEIYSQVKCFALEIMSFNVSKLKKFKKVHEKLNIDFKSEKIEIKYDQVNDIHLVV